MIQFSISVRRATLRSSITIALAVWVATQASAQVPSVIHPDTSGPPSSGRSSVVRDSFGQLHAVVATKEPNTTFPIRLFSSLDGGFSWTATSVQFNDGSSGLNVSSYANGCSVAIDGQDRLHVTWGRYHYPTFFSQYYRSYDLSSGSLSGVVNLSASTSIRTDAAAIEVDSQGYVWLITQGQSNWEDRLARSALPYASNLVFNDLGEISSNGASAQYAQIAIDASDRCHVTFYNNTAAGVLAHRIHDGTTWLGPQQVLGNSTGSQDYYSALAADTFGNVHCAYALDGPSNPIVQYRMFSNSAWSPPATITPLSLATGNADTFTLIAEESSGAVHMVFRDPATSDALVLHTKMAAASAFSFAKQIYPPSSVNNDFFRPSPRGTLFPVSNRSEQRVAITLRHGGQAPYAFEYVDLFSSPAVSIVGSGCAGSGGFVPTLLFTSGTLQPQSNIQLQISNALGGTPGLLLAGIGTGTAPITPSCALHITGIVPAVFSFAFPGAGAGNGSISLFGPIPALPTGTSFAIQAFVIDPGVPAGFSNTHALKLVVQ